MGRGNSPQAAGPIIAALIVAFVAVPGPIVPAGATGLTTVLAPGRVVPASAPPATTLPADGRLRGADFVATVTGVAWPRSVLAQGLKAVAGSGQRLVVFTLRVSQPGDEVGPLAGQKAVTATVGVDGRQLPVDLSQVDQQIGGVVGNATGSGSGTFVVSVPAHDHDVVLTLTEAGFSQRFDLWTLERVSPSPLILYRDPRTSTVTSATPSTALLPTVNPADGYSNPAKLTLSGATLTYFAPDGSGSTPKDTSEAFLVPDLAASPNIPTFGSPTQGHYFSTLTTLSSTQVTFTPTGGSPVHATTAPLATTAGSPTGDDGLFDAQYWFAVPALTTSGTITVSAPSALGVEYTGFSATAGKVPLDLPTPARLSVSFPANPAPPKAQRTPPWVGAPLPPTGVAAVGSRGLDASSGGGGFPVWLAVVMVAVLAALAVGAERVVRRRRMHVSTAAGDPSTTVLSTTIDPVPAPPSSPKPPSAFVSAPDNETPPPLGGPGDLVVRVLGPVEVTGWQALPERRGVAEELCCYLSLHPGRAFTTAELLSALWPVGGERGEATPKTLHNHLSRLRQAVGTDRLPDAVTSGGYRLVSTVSDWGKFTRLAAEAAATSGEEADARRRQALSLVRGVPFADARGGQYEWAFATSLASTMTVAVADCARRLSADRLAAGDSAGAETAARSGLTGAPHDETLWLDAARASRASGDVAREARAWRDAVAALGPERTTGLRRQLEE